LKNGKLPTKIHYNEFVLIFCQFVGVALVIFLWPTLLQAAVLTSTGTWEMGFASLAPLTAISTGNPAMDGGLAGITISKDWALFATRPFVGYFFSDEFELGLEPVIGILFDQDLGLDFGLRLAPQYNYGSGPVYTFGGLFMGYETLMFSQETIVSDSEPSADLPDEFIRVPRDLRRWSFGVEGGAKIEIASNVLAIVKLQAQYLYLDQAQDSKDYLFSVLLGLTYAIAPRNHPRIQDPSPF
jgi:hypothetical protein